MASRFFIRASEYKKVPKEKDSIFEAADLYVSHSESKLTLNGTLLVSVPHSGCRSGS